MKKFLTWYIFSSSHKPFGWVILRSFTMITNLHNLHPNKDLSYKHQVPRNLTLTNLPSSTPHMPRKLPLQHLLNFQSSYSNAKCQCPLQDTSLPLKYLKTTKNLISSSKHLWSYHHLETTLPRKFTLKPKEFPLLNTSFS